MPVFGPSGGYGGNEFNDEPQFEPDSKLVRVAVRGKTFVDSIEIIHERPNGSLISFDHHGGTGGKEHFLNLNVALRPVREHIVLVEGRYGDFVDHITITTSQNQVLSVGGSGGEANYRYEVVPGFEIAGFYGRSMALLDAVGIVLRAL